MRHTRVPRAIALPLAIATLPFLMGSKGCEHSSSSGASNADSTYTKDHWNCDNNLLREPGSPKDKYCDAQEKGVKFTGRGSGNGKCKDWKVARTVYGTAVGAGVNPGDTLMLATIETIIVESRCRNLGDLGSRNDHDSRGPFQQRLKYYQHPNDVPWATREFLKRARAVQKHNRYISAGDLAYAVQQCDPRYAGRYDEERQSARDVIARLRAGK
jgi:hypothetical protein